MAGDLGDSLEVQVNDCHLVLEPRHLAPACARQLQLEQRVWAPQHSRAQHTQQHFGSPPIVPAAAAAAAAA
eukprot:CAMPEP_0202342254 /NCGR_PEP_ID=MMETSP1126-20121109/2896_1 /ASSEMBLY_ACC=CAM_ASM_000457 /TAXON_ID=3047 /ORGANISM="Dunaliella tertiolecta, Strain CCMP1320" /LENGTH=70 /DNA_ID=CAMNT_0048933181 /DNA_START=1999 /DNA_END=2207 /DNA_ORIENTATION=+